VNEHKFLFNHYVRFYTLSHVLQHSQISEQNETPNIDDFSELPGDNIESIHYFPWKRTSKQIIDTCKCNWTIETIETYSECVSKPELYQRPCRHQTIGIH